MGSIFGCHGAMLRVDLTAGRSQRECLDEEFLRQFPGGSGLGTALLLREGAAEREALAADSSLVFVFSPLVGSPLWKPCRKSRKRKMAATPKEGAKNQLDCPRGYIRNTLTNTAIGPENAMAL